MAGQVSARSFKMTGWRDLKYNLWKSSFVIPSSRGIDERLSLVTNERAFGFEKNNQMRVSGKSRKSFYINSLTQLINLIVNLLRALPHLKTPKATNPRAEN